MTARRPVRHRSRADLERALGAANQNDALSGGQPPVAPREYEVGYGKPPKASQFKKGQSGNRRGRPKGSKNLRTLVGRELDRKITARIDGRPKMVSCREAIIMKIVQQALSGRDRAIATLFKLDEALELDAAKMADTVRAQTGESLEAEDRKILEDYMASLLEDRTENAGPPRHISQSKRRFQR